MENWTNEWFFIIGGIILVIAIYVKRDKIPGLGGGKSNSDVKPRRK